MPDHHPTKALPAAGLWRRCCDALRRGMGSFEMAAAGPDARQLEGLNGRRPTTPITLMAAAEPFR